MARATIYIGADTAKANAALKSTSKSVAAFGKATVNAGAKVASGLMTMTAAFAAVAIAVGKKSVDAFIESENAQMRLVTISKQTLNATQEQIQAFNDQARALADVTTIEDDAITVGQSQLASFTRSAKVVEILTGDMLDLAVAQYGANVSGDQMQQTANMVGKALSGQLGAMTRAGVLVSEDLKKAFEEANTEEERAAVISEILASNYGGLAEAAALTAEGGILQLKNALSDMGEEIGAVIIPAIVAILPEIKKAFKNNLPAIKNIYQGLIDILSGKEGGGKKLSSGISDLMGRVVDGVVEALPELVTAFTEIMTALVDSIVENKEGIKEAVTTLVETLGVELVRLVPEVMALGVELFTTLLQSFADADIGGEIANGLALIVDAISDNSEELTNAALEIVIGLVEGLTENLPQIIDAIVKMIPDIAIAIIEHAPELLAAGVNLVMGIVSGIVEAMPEIIQAVVDVLVAGYETAKQEYDEYKRTGKKLTENVIAGMKESDLPGAAKDQLMGIVTAYSDSYGNMYGIGKNMVQGLIDGFDSKAEDLLNAAGRVSKTALKAIRNMNEIKSPSRVYYRIGEYMMEGWANGITENSGLLESAMGQSINSLGRPLLAGAGGNSVNNYSYSTYAPQTNMSVNSLLTDKGALLQLSRLLDNAKALENVRRGVSA